jgi:UrcA family protein
MTMNTTKTTAGKRIDVRCIALAILATACLAQISTAVQAADKFPDSEVMRKTVNYGDLNLTKQQGVEQLYHRIAGAANQVCARLDGRSLQEKVQYWICTKQSIARAVAAVDRPALTALHGIKTGQPETTTKLAKQ